MLFDRIYKHVPPVDQNAFTLALIQATPISILRSMHFQQHRWIL